MQKRKDLKYIHHYLNKVLFIVINNIKNWIMGHLDNL